MAMYVYIRMSKKLRIYSYIMFNYRHLCLELYFQRNFFDCHTYQHTSKSNGWVGSYITATKSVSA